MISHAKLNIPVDIAQVQSEVARLPNVWNSHFNVKHYEGEWTVLSLRVPGGDVNTIIPELDGKEFTDTSLMEHCPAIKALLQNLHCPVHSVRLLNLKSGAIIKQHRDHELAFENGEARLHVPITTNEQVEFYIDEQLLRMLPGECWYINANLPHRVSNHGTTDRIHLVIDCRVNDWLKELFEQAEKTYASPDHEHLLKVINELKLQGTEVSRQLARQLEQDYLRLQAMV